MGKLSSIMIDSGGVGRGGGGGRAHTPWVSFLVS